MHESPVAQELVRVAIETAQSHGVEHVTKMVLNVGPEGEYVAESLRSHIQFAASGSVVEGCEIEITTVPQGGVELVSVDVGDAS